MSPQFKCLPKFQLQSLSSWDQKAEIWFCLDDNKFWRLNSSPFIFYIWSKIPSQQCSIGRKGIQQPIFFLSRDTFEIGPPVPQMHPKDWRRVWNVKSRCMLKVLVYCNSVPFCQDAFCHEFLIIQKTLFSPYNFMHRMNTPFCKLSCHL